MLVDILRSLSRSPYYWLRTTSCFPRLPKPSARVGYLSGSIPKKQNVLSTALSGACKIVGLFLLLWANGLPGCVSHRVLLITGCVPRRVFL